MLVFLFGIVGGLVHLGTLGTEATNRPILPVPGDCDDGEISGMMIGKGKQSTPRKPSPVLFVHHKTHMPARTRILVAAVGIQRLTA
jgi:hypothetical protein